MTRRCAVGRRLGVKLPGSAIAAVPGRVVRDPVLIFSTTASRKATE